MYFDIPEREIIDILANFNYSQIISLFVEKFVLKR